MQKAIEKLIAKRILLQKQMDAYMGDDGSMGIADMMLHKIKKDRILALNYAISVLGE